MENEITYDSSWGYDNKDKNDKDAFEGDKKISNNFTAILWYTPLSWLGFKIEPKYDIEIIKEYEPEEKQ